MVTQISELLSITMANYSLLWRIERDSGVMARSEPVHDLSWHIISYVC